MNHDTMYDANRPVTSRTVWQHDMPAASDLTFMLATLQRIEQRRWRHSVLRLWVNTGVAALVSWALWPWLSEMFATTVAMAAVLDVTPVAFGLLGGAMLWSLLVVWRERR